MIFLWFLKRFINDQRGVVVSWVGILVPVLLLITAPPAADFGRVLIVKHSLQAMCDAAALAGASATRGQFLYDGSGNVNGQTLVVDVPTCDQYAQDTFDQNITVSGLDKQLATITSYQGWPVDTNGDGYLDSYHVKIVAQIRTIILGPMMGMNTFQKTIEAQSMVKQKS